MKFHRSLWEGKMKMRMEPVDYFISNKSWKASLHMKISIIRNILNLVIRLKLLHINKDHCHRQATQKQHNIPITTINRITVVISISFHSSMDIRQRKLVACQIPPSIHSIVTNKCTSYSAGLHPYLPLYTIIMKTITHGIIQIWSSNLHHNTSIEKFKVWSLQNCRNHDQMITFPHLLQEIQFLNASKPFKIEATSISRFYINAQYTPGIVDQQLHAPKHHSCKQFKYTTKHLAFHFTDS